MIRSNPVRQLLERDQPAFGVMISIVRNPEIGLIMASGGYDFFVVDMEHSPLSLESVTDIVMASRATNISPMVRPPSKTADALYRVLDVGAEGLLVPHVDTRDDVEYIIKMTKYHPLGQRGMAMAGLVEKAQVGIQPHHIDGGKGLIIEQRVAQAEQDIDGIGWGVVHTAMKPQIRLQ